jgi:hypothetical protein
MTTRGALDKAGKWLASTSIEGRVFVTAALTCLGSIYYFFGITPVMVIAMIGSGLTAVIAGTAWLENQQ